jgi:hypothetical protein
MTEISDADLRLIDIPSSDAEWGEIGAFALTFNGYEYWGSFEKCAEIANAKRHDSLTDLRTCLFFEQRRWRHYGFEPDDAAMQEIRLLLEQIRGLVSSALSK